MTENLTAATRNLTANLDWYAPVFRAWPGKFAGDRPGPAMFAVAHALVKSHNPGIEALHIAMCLRPGGCTVQQFCTAGSCGPANNTRRRLVAAGYFKVSVTGKPYAFTLILTPRGEAVVLKHVTHAATAVSGDAPKAKARKRRKAVKLVTVSAGDVTSTPVPVNVERPASEPQVSEPEAPADQQQAA